MPIEYGRALMPALLMFRIRDLNLLLPQLSLETTRKVAEAHTEKLGNAVLFLHYSKL